MTFQCSSNADNYDVTNQEALTAAGVWRIDSGVEAMQKISDPKNIKLFEDMKVMSQVECDARKNVMLDHYTGTVEMEALCMIDMLNKNVIPSVKAAGVGPLADLEAAVKTLKSAVAAIHAADDNTKQAELARVLRLETMISIRETCDAAESVCPADLWTLATYKDLLFLDKTIE
jgi:glutamine synthetase